MMPSWMAAQKTMMYVDTLPAKRVPGLAVPTSANPWSLLVAGARFGLWTQPPLEFEFLLSF